MEVFDFVNVKAEKVNVMLRYNRLQTIKTLFRFLELFLGLLLLSWTSCHLPFVVKITGDYFRQFVSIIINPFAIFIICNVIVVTLLLKSGHSDTIDEGKTNLYEDQFITQSVSETILGVNTAESYTNSYVKEIDDKSLSNSKKLRPLQDEKPLKEREDEDEDEDEDEALGVGMIDELSNEEFQRAIEAFIAKQVKFRQQEKLAIVLHSQA